MILEACVESLAEAIKAEDLGANRIELCDRLDIGGITPPPETLIACKKRLKIPVMVMIRPRGGDFIFTDQEIEQMQNDIVAYRKAGADGIVTGVLTPSGHVDMAIVERMVELAGPCAVTFHKAIDETRDIPGEIMKLKNSGIRRVLSSGGYPTAREGVEMLNAMIRSAAGRIVILAAGKVTAENIAELSHLIHTNEFHGRKIVGDLT
jgi:copper homeostasis protein